MAASLEFGRIPAIVVRRLPLHIAKLNFICCPCGVHIHRKMRFQKDVVRLPVRLCPEINPWKVVIKANSLCDNGIYKSAGKLQHNTDVPTFHNTDR